MRGLTSEPGSRGAVSRSGPVAAPVGVVSATLTELAVLGLGEGHLVPGEEVPLLGLRFRITAVGVDGLRAELVGGPAPACSLDVLLTDTPAGVLVTARASWRGFRLRREPVRRLLDGVTRRVATRAAELRDAPVVVGAVIVRGRTLLAQQRSYPPAAAGLWELPGGRVEPGETDADAVRRECREELGIDVEVGPRLGPDVALRGGRLLRLHLATTGEEAVPYPHDHAALRWLTAGQLGSVPWLPADRVLVPTLRAALRAVPGHPTPASRSTVRSRCSPR